MGPFFAFQAFTDPLSASIEAFAARIYNIVADMRLHTGGIPSFKKVQTFFKVEEAQTSIILAFKSREGKKVP